jgi:hypothetical protein
MLAAGCYSSSIRVVQMIPVDKPRQRLYVLVHEGAIESWYAGELSGEMSTALTGRLVSKTAIVTGVEFDKGPLDRDIAAFQPEGVLLLKPIGTRSGGKYGRVRYLSYEATLVEHPSNRPIWAAKAEVSGEHVAVSAIADSVVESLAKSGMIPAAPAMTAPSCSGGSRSATGSLECPQ